MSGEGPVFAVGFDEFAMIEDLARLGEGGADAFAGLVATIERMGGLPRKRLMACEAEGRDGTRLGGCLLWRGPHNTHYVRRTVM